MCYTCFKHECNGEGMPHTYWDKSHGKNLKPWFWNLNRNIKLGYEPRDMELRSSTKMTSEYGIEASGFLGLSDSQPIWLPLRCEVFSKAGSGWKMGWSRQSMTAKKYEKVN